MRTNSKRIEALNSHFMSQSVALNEFDPSCKIEIKSFYAGKNVLLSGCTGFLGKVILEKLLRSCPDIGQIFILLRGKKHKQPIDRIKTEILDSMCFQRCKRERAANSDQGQGDFIQFALDKITYIQGDLTRDKLGLKEEDRRFLTTHCDAIINSAASVNFDDPLQDALKINYFGCMRMLELAKECEKLQVFTHVSTAYVNCDRDEYCAETIYDKGGEGQDIENKVQKWMAMNPAEIASKQAEILGKFPNTYTFTKNMAEKVLKMKRGNLNVVIFRPSIIAASS